MASNQFNTKIIKNESGAYSNVPTLFWTDDVETLKNIAKQLSSNDGNHYFITSKEVLNHYCSYEKPNDYNKHILFFSSNTADKIVIPRAIPGKVYKSFQENNVQVNEKLRFDSFNNDKTGYGDQEEKIEGFLRSILFKILYGREEYLKNISSVQIPSTEYGYDSMIDGIYYFQFNLDKAKEDFNKYYYFK